MILFLKLYFYFLFFLLSNVSLQIFYLKKCLYWHLIDGHCWYDIWNLLHIIGFTSIKWYWFYEFHYFLSIKNSKNPLKFFKMSNITVTNYFITLLQIIDITNSYSFSFELTTNIIFSLTTLLVCNLTIFI